MIFNNIFNNHNNHITISNNYYTLILIFYICHESSKPIIHEDTLTKDDTYQLSHEKLSLC